MDFISRQDIFDSQACLPAIAVGIIMDFSKTWEKHEKTIASKGMTEEVLADYKKLAVKYDVEYTAPREASSFLKLVDREGQSPTRH
ncbi:MAG: hypothetical protein DRI88_10415 [Bacteroidetes bacterium]|nr:MAG: hypothetical protein DRI88_10415 [Bacteroidota bacterium]